MPGEMLAIVFVRDGVIPAGGDEVVAECSGRALVCGSGAKEAADTLAGQIAADQGQVTWLDDGAGTTGDGTPGFRPASLAARLSALPEVVGASVIVLPGSPDGRDLAPRLAHALHRPLLAGAIRVTERQAWVARGGGREIHEVTATTGSENAFVATLIPGSRGVQVADNAGGHATSTTTGAPGSAPADNVYVDCDVLEVLGPDVATMDLAEAPRIMGGGAGLDSPERFGQLTEIATALGASVGATRVITDRGWVPHQRQIGTTGCVIDPDLYLAFGISGAVQHTAGLGQPEHIVSVNTDPHCPMMQLADLAIVSDANLVVEQLRARLADSNRGQGAA